MCRAGILFGNRVHVGHIDHPTKDYALARHRDSSSHNLDLVTLIL